MEMESETFNRRMEACLRLAQEINRLCDGEDATVVAHVSVSILASAMIGMGVPVDEARDFCSEVADSAADKINESGFGEVQ